MKAPDFEPTPIAWGRWRDWRWHGQVLLWAYPAAMLVLAAGDGARAIVAMLASLACWASAVGLQVLLCPRRPEIIPADDDAGLMMVWPLGLDLDGLFSSYWRILKQGPARLARPPLGNAVVALACAIGLGLLNVQMSWNPLTLAGPWMISAELVPTFSAAWWLGRMGHAHWVLALAGLIPAMPLAGGQVLAILLDDLKWPELDARRIRRWFAVGSTLGLVAVGAGAALSSMAGGYCLMLVGLTVGLEARRQERRDAAVAFLDAFIASVDEEDDPDFERALDAMEKQRNRPLREVFANWYSARRLLKSQKRYDRQVRQEKANEQRLDELLAVIHEQGSRQLSRSDRQFLKRMSRTYKQRRNGT